MSIDERGQKNREEKEKENWNPLPEASRFIVKGNKYDMRTRKKTSNALVDQISTGVLEYQTVTRCRASHDVNYPLLFPSLGCRMGDSGWHISRFATASEDGWAVRNPKMDYVRLDSHVSSSTRCAVFEF